MTESTVSTLSRPRPVALESQLQVLGLGMIRYGLILILLMGGLEKWTTAEAEGIRPWIAHSPFLSWLYSITSVQGASIVIGVFELATALLIGMRRWMPKLAAAGGMGGILMFLITLSFLITTPNQGPDAQGFLMKDFFLLGASVWICGEALEAAKR